MQRQPPHPPRTAKSSSQNQAGQAKIPAKPKYDSSPARPIHRSRQGCRRIPAIHSPHPLRQENQVHPPHPLLPICVLMKTSRQGKSPIAGRHTEQGRKITSPPQHAAMTNARHCKAQRTALRRPMHRTPPKTWNLNDNRRIGLKSRLQHTQHPPRSTLHFAPFTLHFPKEPLFTLHFSLLTSRRDQAGATHLRCRPCRVSVMYEMVNACACWHA